MQARQLRAKHRSSQKQTVALHGSKNSSRHRRSQSPHDGAPTSEDERAASHNQVRSISPNRWPWRLSVAPCCSKGCQSRNWETLQGQAAGLVWGDSEGFAIFRFSSVKLNKLLMRHLWRHSYVITGLTSIVCPSILHLTAQFIFAVKMIFIRKTLFQLPAEHSAPKSVLKRFLSTDWASASEKNCSSESIFSAYTFGTLLSHVLVWEITAPQVRIYMNVGNHSSSLVCWNVSGRSQMTALLWFTCVVAIAMCTILHYEEDFGQSQGNPIQMTSFGFSWLHHNATWQ